MTIKEIRAKQLDELKEHGNGEVLYCVAVLNSGFIEYHRVTFQTMREAEMYYAECSKWNPPAFVAKYAIVNF